MKNLIPWKWGKQKEPALVSSSWLSNFWDDPFESLMPSTRDSFSWNLPLVDVSENKKEVSVRAEIPGLSQEDLSLTYHDGILSIQGEKKEEHENKKDGMHYRECKYGSFSRDIPLYKGLDWQNAKAKYKKGVLTVTIPKSKENKKQIELKIN